MNSIAPNAPTVHTSEKCKETYSFPKGKSYKHSSASTKFTLYTGTPLAVLGVVEEFHEIGDGRRYLRTRSESWMGFQKRALYKELTKEGHRIINLATYKEHYEISDQEIAERLEAMVPDLCDKAGIPAPTSSYEVAMGNRDASTLTWERVSDLIEDAVIFCRDTWDPTVYPALQERGRKGGQAGKKYNMTSYVQTAHMSPTEAARALGISRPTVYAMRREFADLNPDGKSGNAATEEETQGSEPTVTDSVRDRVGTSTGNTGKPLEIHDQGAGNGSNLGADRTEGLRVELAELTLAILAKSFSPSSLTLDTLCAIVVHAGKFLTVSFLPGVNVSSRSHSPPLLKIPQEIKGNQMSRRSQIVGSPAQGRVDELIDAGATLKEISTTTKFSISSVFRYKEFRKGNVARAFDNEPNPLDLLTRLIHAADAARLARKAAAGMGSPTGLTRAIATEAQILGRLITELDVRDTTVTELHAEVEALIAGMRRLVKDDPDSAVALANALATEKTLLGLADALKAAVKEKTR